MIILVAAIALAVIILRNLVKKHFDVTPLSSSKLGEENPKRLFDTVVVIGGSLAGLMAASVMAHHSRKVIVIERTNRDDKPDKGSIVSQSDQFHVLLRRGLQVTTKLYGPSFVNDLLAKGVEVSTAESYWFGANGQRVRYAREENNTTISCGRDTYEKTIYEHTKKLNNIEFREGIVTGFLYANQHITGVKLRDGELNADLVVDCSGFATNSPFWFKEIGMNLEKSYVKFKLGYSSYLAKGNPNEIPDNVFYYFPSDKQKAAAFLRISPDTWIVSCMTFAEGVKSFTSHEEIYETTEEFPMFYEHIQKMTPITKVTNYRKLGSQSYGYEKLNLKGLVALGDCVCSFNPTYGQGMSSAAEACSLLDMMLREGYDKNTFCNKYQKSLARKLLIPWLIVCSTDLKLKGVETNNPLLKWLVKPVTGTWGKTAKRCVNNVELQQCMSDVLHMQEGAILNFISPKFYWKVLFG